MRMWRRCSTARTASGCCGHRRVITRPLRLAMLLQRKPPEFSVLSPANGTQVQADTVDIALDVPPAVDVVEGFDLTVNGRRVASRESATVKPGELLRAAVRRRQ